MNAQIQERLLLFAENVRLIKSEFPFHDALIKRMDAALYSMEGKRIDCGAIRNAHSLIKCKTGLFSAMRGNMSLCLAALISLSEDNKDSLLSNTILVYDMLRGAGFFQSDFLVMAAYQIAAHTDPNLYSQAVARTREFYKSMKSYHWFLTSQDDYIFAAMLGLSELDVSAATDRIEQLYQWLKPEFFAKNSVQTLAQTLVLGERPEDAAQRVVELRDTLKAMRNRLDRGYSMPFLGVLALLPADVQTIAQDIEDAKRFLRTQRGFGVFTFSTQEVLMFSAAIVAAVYAADMKDNVLTASLSTSITNIIIAQEVAMMTAMSASVAAANASHTSS